MDRHDAVELIRRAIADERLKVFLQPIVMLPQRRVCHYEALARLRGEDGAFFLPSDFLAVAEPAGLTPLIDDAVLTRSLRIARHLSARSSDMMVFCNLSARSLADGRLFARITEAVERARDLAGKLVFELRQEMLDDLGPLETSGLQALGELGARFSIDGRHLDIDGAAWAARRVRFAKINAGMLLDPPSSSGAHIHAADLAKLLARSGIELIAARIESEAELVDLLDYDIRFG